MSISHEVHGDGRCEAPDCRQYDFLPCKCHLCGKTFCSAHKSYEAHACSKFVDRKLPQCPICGQMVLLTGGVAADVAVSRHIDKGCPKEALAAPVKERLNFCSFPGCRENEHVTIICHTCGDTFCIKHRNEDAHNCRKMRNPGARTPPPLRAASSSPSATPPASSSPSQSEPTLGHPGVKFQNTPDRPFVSSTSHEVRDSVPVRVYLPPGSGAAPCHFLIHGSWVVGRVLDLVCSKVGVINRNNQGGEKLRVYSLRTFDELPSSARLEDAAQPHDALFICTYPKLPDVIMAEAMHYVWPAERALQPQRSSASVPALAPTPAPTPPPPQPAPQPKPSLTRTLFGFGRKKPKTWNCSACTFENDAKRTSCEMCGTPK